MPLSNFSAIATPRLTLRPVETADLADLMAINGDEQVTRFLPYATWQSAQDGLAWLARMQALAAGGTALQLVAQRNADRRVVATVLLFKFDEGSARIELGYALGRAHWGQGLMHEALTAVCRHAFAAMAVRRIEAEVNPSNLASNRLLLALGFVCEGRLRQRWVSHKTDGSAGAYDTQIYGLLASDLPKAP